jgi:oligopeptide/dipeptide ABC transporter ATP-binding protein
MAASDTVAAPAPVPTAVPLVEVRDLVKHYRLRRRWKPGEAVDTVRALDGVSFSVDRGKTFGLVGESGCGKTTLGRVLLRLERPTSGEVHFDGEDWLAKRGSELRRARRGIQAIFQDPLGSLDPRRRVIDAVAEAIEAHDPGASSGDRRVRGFDALQSVGLNADIGRRYPHELSGGQRQRVTVARAISVEPRFVVCDEAVSALDVSVQAQVVNLLDDLKESLGIGYLFISHGLATVWHIADEIGVMYLGKLVERAPADRLFAQPAHPYTAALIAAAPVADPTLARQPTVAGEVPSATQLPSGCRFRTRCPKAEPRCAEVEPELREVAPGQLVACHFPNESASPVAAH